MCGTGRKQGRPTRSFTQNSKTSTQNIQTGAKNIHAYDQNSQTYVNFIQTWMNHQLYIGPTQVQICQIQLKLAAGVFTTAYKTAVGLNIRGLCWPEQKSRYTTQCLDTL